METCIARGGTAMELMTALGLARDVASRELREALYFRTGLNLTRPSDIKISLTDRCNYRCGYCNHWNRPSYRNELDFDQWRGIVDGLRAYLGRYTIQFVGGEPMISPAFLPLVEHCREQGIRWGVITNGSMLRGSRIDRLVAARPLNIDISIDSSRPEIHDAARGVAGSLSRITGGVRQLLAARAASGLRFPIRIKPTVHVLNFDHLREIVGWAQDMGGLLVDFSPVGLTDKEGQARFYVTSDEALARLDEEIEALIALKQGGAPIEASVEKLRAIGEHFRGARITQARSSCVVGLRALYVRPDGSVDHCWRFRDRGNLAEEKPAQLWARTRATVADEAVRCAHITTNRCGVACTSHRKLAQDVRRGLLYAGIGRKRGVPE